MNVGYILKHFNTVTVCQPQWRAGIQKAVYQLAMGETVQADCEAHTGSCTIGPGIKRPGLGAHHPPPPSAEVGGFGGLEVACWPLVPTFPGSNPAEAVGFFRAKTAVCPMS